jgi:hypothetical protein
LSQVEVAPPCLSAIEPAGGWQPRGVTTAEDLAITALKTLDMEHELPPDATPIELRADEFRVEAPPDAVEAAMLAGDSAPPGGLSAGNKGLRAITSIEIPEAGLYTIYGFLTPGAGQRWLVDGCRKAVVCQGDRVGWKPVLSQSFSAGRHSLIVSLGGGGGLERIRVERKKNSPSDYVATARRLGLDPGPGGAISRDTAISAMDFIADRRDEVLCGDEVVVDETPLPPPLLADLPDPTAPVPPASGLPPVFVNQPLLPPQAPASPIEPVEG